MKIDPLSTPAALNGAAGSAVRHQAFSPVHNANSLEDSQVKISSEAGALQQGGGLQVSQGGQSLLGGLEGAFGAVKAKEQKSQSESKLIQDCEALMAMIHRRQNSQIQSPDRLKDVRKGRDRGHQSRVDLAPDRSGRGINDKGHRMVHQIKLGVSRVAAEYGEQGLPANVSGLYEKTMRAASEAGLN